MNFRCAFASAALAATAMAAGGAPASSEQGSRLRDANVRESGAAPSSAGAASVSGVTSPKGAPVPPSDGAPPETIKASYDVYKDGLHVAVVQESYARNGAKYHIVSESNPAGLLALFVRARVKVRSSGAVTPAGLRPEQFEYGRLDDASKNVSAEFDWNAALLRMAFDGRNETIHLPAGTQDRLSIMYQFMFVPAEKLRELALEMTNGKKIEHYFYQFAGNEQLDTPLGKLSTLHLVKQREPGENGTEVWLAPERNFFPVKLLILENDGSKFEQVITQLEFK